jgi:hypothetical protein
VFAIPTDSTDAREQREIEHERVEAERAEETAHASDCVGGWLGEDAEGRPRPCPRCRPSLMHVPCRTCGVAYQACTLQGARRRGPCCDACDHSRRSRARVVTGRPDGVSGAEVVPGLGMRVELPGSRLSPSPQRLVVVHDPTVGSVPVRWRAAFDDVSWIWRCGACGARSRTPDCPHALAAARFLVGHLLGLELQLGGQG